MQSSANLDAQVKTLISKSSPSKPHGFALVTDSEDGTPALFIEKKESMARKEAKAELKVAKKKKLITGLIYIEQKKLVLKPGIKPLKEALILKAFKKLKAKSKRYASLFGKIPSFIHEEQEDLETILELEEESNQANPKFLELWQRLQARWEDLQNGQFDAAQLFGNVASIFQSPNTSPTEEQNRLLEKTETRIAKIYTVCQDLSTDLTALEQYIHINDQENIKPLAKEIKSSLQKYEDRLEILVQTIEALNAELLDIRGDRPESIFDMSAIEIFLRQAQNLRASKDVRALFENNPEPSFYDRVFANQNKKIKQLASDLNTLIGNLETLCDKEKKGKPVSQKHEKKAEKELFTLRKRCSEYLVKQQIPALGDFSEKVRTIWDPAIRQSRIELQRCKTAIFSNPVVCHDPRFKIIRKSIAQAQIQLSLPPNIPDIKSLKKELQRLNLEPERKKWKSIDSSSLFGSFAIDHPIEQAIQVLSNIS